MALFKPFIGDRQLLNNVPVTNGHVYFCTDGTYHVDYEDQNGVARRKQINAKNAETLSGKTLEEILLSSGAQSDWNQNDPNSGAYIHNRPFYSAPEAIEFINDVYISEDIGNGIYVMRGSYANNHTFDDQSNDGIYYPMPQKVKVVFNETEYELQVQYLEGIGTVAGNIGLLNILGYNFPITTEPFMIQLNLSEFTMLTDNLYVEDIYDVSLYIYTGQEIVQKKLDSKFLEDSIPTKTWVGDYVDAIFFNNREYILNGGDANTVFGILDITILQ